MSYEAILQFSGEYRWLSNFLRTPEPIVLDDEWGYHSTEAAYMSMKSKDMTWKEFCRDTEKDSAIKAESYKIALRSDWEDIKVDVMRRCLKLKFSQEPLRTKLLETGNCHLSEGNNHGDTYWGVSLETGLGENMLGRLLMETRLWLQHIDKHGAEIKLDEGL